MDLFALLTKAERRKPRTKRLAARLGGTWTYNRHGHCWESELGTVRWVSATVDSERDLYQSRLYFYPADETKPPECLEWGRTYHGD